MIEAIVAIVFGVVITVVGACTSAGVAVIVLGALLLATGIGCLIYEIISKKKAAAKLANVLLEKDVEYSRLAHKCEAIERELALTKTQLTTANEKLHVLQAAKVKAEAKTTVTKTTKSAKATTGKSTTSKSTKTTTKVK